MKDTKVLVMAAIAANGRDLRIVMVAQPEGEVRVSQVVTLKGEADSRDGNPYCIYGDAVAKWLGCYKFDTSISVFSCTCGNLESWL